MMMRQIGVLITCLWLAACSTTNTKLATSLPEKPPANATILLVRPDVELSELNVAGINEPKAEWNESARTFISSAIAEQLKTRSHSFKDFDPATSASGRIGQVLKLNRAVGQSIMLGSYAGALPTKKTFDWTLGTGTRELKTAQSADYALFVTSQGNFSSSGRQAAKVIGALAGVSLPPAMQVAQASLVDLESGRVLWSNFMVAGPAADQRNATGARTLVESLLKDLPL